MNRSHPEELGQLLAQAISDSTSYELQAGRRSTSGKGDEPFAARRRLDDAFKRFKEAVDESPQLCQYVAQHVEVNNAICARLLHPRGGLQDDQVCKWLYNMYHSGSQELCSLALQFVPVLVWSLLLRQTKQQPPAGILAVLMVIYNTALERQRTDADPLLLRAAAQPDLSLPSIYHKPNKPRNESQGTLTESALRRHDGTIEEKSSEILVSIKSLSLKSTLQLVHVCLQRYNYNIARMCHLSHQQICAVAARLSAVGLQGDCLKDVEHLMVWKWRWAYSPFKYSLNSAVLQDFLQSVAFCTNTSWARPIATVALWHVHSRALQDLLPEVLLCSTCLLEEVSTPDTNASPWTLEFAARFNRDH